MMRWMQGMLEQSEYDLESLDEGSSSGAGMHHHHGGDVSAGAIIAAVLIVEVVVIAMLLGCLYRRKQATESLAQTEAASMLNQSLMPEDNAAAAPYRWVIFVTIGMFSGYASLVLLQHHLMGVMEGNITNENGACAQSNATLHMACTLTNDDAGECGFPGYATKGPMACKMGSDGQKDFESLFKHAASFNYIGNLIFRIAHNFVFAPFIPRHRVVISLSAMLASMLLLGLGVYQFEGTSLNWVYFAYGIGGVGVGTFESNMLAAIAPLGHDTKVWAIIGMPVGFVSISVIGFLLRSPPPVGANLDPMYLYYAVSVALGGGLLMWLCYVPAAKTSGAAPAISSFGKVFSEVGLWLPAILPNCIALMIQMYAVSFFTAIPFYIYNNEFPDGGKISMIFGSGSNALMNHDRYFAVFNMHTFLGDTISRKVAYYFPPAPVLSYVLIIIVGSVLSLLKMPILLWPGLFLIFFANGSIYATTTKHMDNTFKEGTEMAKYHLIALSVWLFVGDIGSVAGSNTWEYFQPILCDGKLGAHDWKYMCIPES